MPRFRVALFDFDGTLADSYAAITASVNHVLEHYGRATLTEGQVRTLVGHGLIQLMQTLLSGVDPDEAAEIYRAHHPSVMKSHTRLLPGVLEGLARLQNAGLTMGVCSNKPSRFTRPLVEMIELGPFFRTILGPEDCGAAKPDPAMLNMSIAQHGAAPTETIYVGDMQVDIETGRNAGIETWVMPTGSHDESTLKLAKPDVLLPNFDAVVRRILES
jgi:phosphoglycolate phosphatase